MPTKPSGTPTEPSDVRPDDKSEIKYEIIKKIGILPRFQLGKRTQPHQLE